MAIQQDLFKTQPPDELVDYLKGRLPQDQLLSVLDLANAINVSVGKARIWVESGRLQSIDIGEKGKPCYRIYRASALRLIEELAGVRKTESKTKGATTR